MVRRWAFIGGVVLAAAAVPQFGTRGYDAQAEPLVAALSQVPKCASDMLGIDADVSAVLKENLAVAYSDFSGRLLVGGNAALRNTNVGTQLAASAERLDLDVGGDANFAGGAIPHGALAVGGRLRQNDVLLAFPARGSSGDEIDVAFAAASSVATRLKQLNMRSMLNFPSAIGERREVYMQAVASDLNVFVLEANDLANAHTLRLEGNENATIVVMVKGTSVDMAATGAEYLGVRSENVLFFFPDARFVRMRGIRVRGSVLAPQARVELSNAVLEGQLVAKSLLGQGEFRKNPFAGCLPK